jgi:predicted DNA-binding transcriptional regulator AlpA
MSTVDKIFRKNLAPDGLPAAGFVRLTGVIAPGGPLPISRSSWWEGVRTRRYPQPVKLGPRITAWRCEDIRALMQQGGA